jgi:hypothetical protein
MIDIRYHILWLDMRACPPPGRFLSSRYRSGFRAVDTTHRDPPHMWSRRRLGTRLQ